MFGWGLVFFDICWCDLVNINNRFFWGIVYEMEFKMWKVYVGV